MLHDASASGRPRLEAQSEFVPHQVFLDQVEGHWCRASPCAASSFGPPVLVVRIEA